MPEVFESAGEDEDVVTGDFGSLIRRGPVKVSVEAPEGGGIWTWRITYKKLRGRGPSATEKHVGADGIWEFTLDHGANGPQRKAALFQAKMTGEAGEKLFTQAVIMSTWREAAFVVEYTPETVFAIHVDDVVAARGKAVGDTARIPFDEFIVEQFISCKIGDRDLLYDRASRRLFWRDSSDAVVVVNFSAKHKFDVNVKPPWYFDPTLPQPDKELKPDEIYEHRMMVQPHEILRVDASATKTELTKARRHIAQLYHPDKVGGLDDQIRAAMNRRMSEVNAAFDEMTGKNARRGR